MRSDPRRAAKQGWSLEAEGWRRDGKSNSPEARPPRVDESFSRSGGTRQQDLQPRAFILQPRPAAVLRNVLAVLAGLFLVGCAGGKTKSEPDHITVDHILVGVRSAKLPAATRTREQARKLAYKLLDTLKKGDGDWTALKKRYSDDPPPGGPYSMANDGVTAKEDETRREDMVPAFGDVGFRLEAGEIGIADYDPKKSPFGYHLIKRVR